MAPAIVTIHYPKGEVPARGFRCPKCSREVLLPGDAEEARSLARRAGMFGMERARRRRLQRTGNSITVSLDPELLRDVLPGAGPGTTVTVGKLGDGIIIQADDSAGA